MRSNARSQAGFTILEIVIVFILLAGIMAFVGPKIFEQMNRAKGDEAKVRLLNVAQNITMYYADTNKYPTSLNDLVQQPGGLEKWHGPYGKAEDLKDAWGNDYVYAVPGKQGKPYDLMSYGADGKAGGEGADRDITN